MHVTPEHQRPLGVLLAPERRIALLDWAARAGAMVLEEDCDGEFRYGGMEAPPLMSLDPGGPGDPCSAASPPRSGPG